MPSRWDCMFVGRVEKNFRIVLATPRCYGLMGEDDPTRATFPGNKQTLAACAFATGFNLAQLPNSKGLIVREYEGRVAYSGTQTAMSVKFGQGLRVRDTTGWKVYISPDIEYFQVDRKGDYRFKGAKLSEDAVSSIKSLIVELVSPRS